MTFLVVQGQRSPCKIKVYEFLYVVNCNYMPICHRFQRYGPLKLAKNEHVLFFAGGPDALNDLKFLSGVESFSIYQIPNTRFLEQKILTFFRDLGFDLQGHRSWCEIKAPLCFPIQG